MSLSDPLRSAKSKDINAFNAIFKQIEKPLKAYLYRLLTQRQDVEDYYHNTFIQAFDNIHTFKGNQVQFKSWIFTIATHLVYDHIKKQKKWRPDAQDVCRDSLVNNEKYQQQFMTKVAQSSLNRYEIKEHIDFCFTCLNKTLALDKQVALLLKDVMKFKVSEVAEIMGRSPGQVKHYLVAARKEMSTLFAGRCALINKKGTCHQCTELQGIFNPRADSQRELLKLQMVKDSKSKSQKQLFKLREVIVQSVDPLNNQGTDLHHHLMKHMKLVNNLDKPDAIDLKR